MSKYIMSFYTKRNSKNYFLIDKVIPSLKCVSPWKSKFSDTITPLPFKFSLNFEKNFIYCAFAVVFNYINL